MASNERTIGSASILCKVIDRKGEGSKKDFDLCSKDAAEAFSRRAIELLMAEAVEIVLLFDGHQATYQIVLGTMEVKLGTLSDSPSGGQLQ